MTYYEEHKEERLKYQKEYNEANKVKISKYFRTYYIKNYDQFMAKNQNYSLNRKYKIKSNNKIENQKVENKIQNNNKNNLVTF